MRGRGRSSRSTGCPSCPRRAPSLYTRGTSSSTTVSIRTSTSTSTSIVREGERGCLAQEEWFGVRERRYACGTSSREQQHHQERTVIVVDIVHQRATVGDVVLERVDEVLGLRYLVGEEALRCSVQAIAITHTYATIHVHVSISRCTYEQLMRSDRRRTPSASASSTRARAREIAHMIGPRARTLCSQLRVAVALCCVQRQRALEMVEKLTGLLVVARSVSWCTPRRRQLLHDGHQNHDEQQQRDDVQQTACGARPTCARAQRCPRNQ